MSPVGASSWHNPKVLLIVFLIFLTGSAAGALGMRYGLRAALQKPASSWKEGGKEISLKQFKKELDLTPEQAAQIETELDDFMMYYQTLQAQLDEVRASGKARILKILKPEQQEKFNRMMSELQARQIK
jgi:Spy/CpxP family protein refolding chaperone